MRKPHTEYCAMNDPYRSHVCDCGAVEDKSGHEDKNRGGESVKSLSPTQETSREWIEKRYGPITTHRQTVMFGGVFSAMVMVVVAAVPVMGGIAIGVGANEDYAFSALRGNLSGDDERLLKIASLI